MASTTTGEPQGSQDVETGEWGKFGKLTEITLCMHKLGTEVRNRIDEIMQETPTDDVPYRTRIQQALIDIVNDQERLKCVLERPIMRRINDA